eukprot:TRINITY_DN16028_c0_g1_i1.p1 TRINITY_DN16028_c0_g1~~TRINITY_DN16028_c0_g1_i1.p1  ORF type:complete len:303 (-),score=44.23 TRINITY_DN16028_c0_g1_i1:43-891(-)
MALPEEDLTLIKNIMGPLGATLACIMFSSAFPVIRSILRSGSVGQYSYFPYFVQSCNCILWVGYAFTKGLDTMFWPFYCNLVGLLIAFPSFCIFTAFCSKEQRTVLIYRSAGPLVVVSSFCLFTLVKDEKWLTDLAGTLCMVINMIMYLGPCAGIRSALATKSTDSLPLSLGVSTVVNSIPWFLYGVAVSDLNIWLPNASGIFFGSLQVSTYAYLTKLAGAPAVFNACLSDDPHMQSFATAGNIFSFVPKAAARNVQSAPNLLVAHELTQPEASRQRAGSAA